MTPSLWIWTELAGTHLARQFETCFAGREDADGISGKTRTAAERALDRILHSSGLMGGRVRSRSPACAYRRISPTQVTRLGS